MQRCLKALVSISISEAIATAISCTGAFCTLFQNLSPLTMPDRLARIPSIHHINATDWLNSVEVIYDNVGFVIGRGRDENQCSLRPVHKLFQ
jgi:hypothetical protein